MKLWPLTFLALVLGLCACGSPRRTGAIPVAPADFSLSVTLVGGGAAAGSTSANPLLQPAWYVLDPDGTLRAALGDRTPGSPVPPIVRQLNRDEVESVWRGVCESGLSDAMKGREDVSDWQLPSPGNTAIFLGADMSRRAVVFDSAAPEVAPVVERLRSLAWMGR